MTDDYAPKRRLNRIRNILSDGFDSLSESLSNGFDSATSFVSRVGTGISGLIAVLLPLSIALLLLSIWTYMKIVVGRIAVLAIASTVKNAIRRATTALLVRLGYGALGLVATLGALAVLWRYVGLPVMKRLDARFEWGFMDWYDDLIADVTGTSSDEDDEDDDDRELSPIDIADDGGDSDVLYDADASDDSDSDDDSASGDGDATDIDRIDFSDDDGDDDGPVRLRASGDGQCNAVTEDGDRCKNPSQDDSAFCHLHIDQSEVESDD